MAVKKRLAFKCAGLMRVGFKRCKCVGSCVGKSIRRCFHAVHEKNLDMCICCR